jgi:hypothetical protein
MEGMASTIIGLQVHIGINGNRGMRELRSTKGEYTGGTSCPQEMMKELAHSFDGTHSPV